MRKFLPYILITVIFAVNVLAPLGTFAASTPPAASSGSIESQLDKTNCLSFPGRIHLPACAATLSYYIFFVPTSALLWFSGQILDVSVSFALDSKTLNTNMVKEGWKITRNLVNLFFIFILLYISIATILQIGGYGMKDLLVKVIIVALLVNFSLVFTRVVIDASNVLAMEFYSKISAPQESAVTVGGVQVKGVSAVFISGFNPQRLLSQDSFQKWVVGGNGSLLVIFIIFLVASIINVIAAFVLFAAAILFIVRIVALWLIMILAPLAFLAMILPSTGRYAKEWWGKLFSQSFFAPIFLFLFYLVAMLIVGPSGGEGFLASLAATLSTSASSSGGVAGGIVSFFKSIAVVIMQFSILAVLLVACLIIAGKMGAHGAGAMQKLGTNARKWGQSYAGRIGRRGVGFASEKALNHAYGTDEKGNFKNKGKTAVALRAALKIPGAAQGAARASSWREKQKAETKKRREKVYGSYSTAGLAALQAQRMIMPSRREVIEEKLEGKQKADKEKVEIKKLKNERKGLKLREKSENWDEGRKKIQDKIEVHKKTNKLEYGSPGSWEREMEKLDNEMAEFMKSTYDKINGINSKLNKKKENAIIGEAQKLIKKAQSGGGGEAPKLAPKTEKA
ncbi:MAG TPA: hypothetical protein ENG99_00735 [bacterium]|nr:hypothetical protein [bacterium]